MRTLDLSHIIFDIIIKFNIKWWDGIYILFYGREQDQKDKRWIFSNHGGKRIYLLQKANHCSFLSPKTIQEVLSTNIKEKHIKSHTQHLIETKSIIPRHSIFLETMNLMNQYAMTITSKNKLTLFLSQIKNNKT